VQDAGLVGASPEEKPAQNYVVTYVILLSINLLSAQVVSNHIHYIFSHIFNCCCDIKPIITGGGGRPARSHVWVVDYYHRNQASGSEDM
jgi:hypothetical protein